VRSSKFRAAFSFSGRDRVSAGAAIGKMKIAAAAASALTRKTDVIDLTNQYLPNRSLWINKQFQRLAAGKEIFRIQIMKITKNIGMLLLAVYLIIDGLLGFGLNLGPAIFLLYLVALAAGFCILIGK
jgi:hypothetical protein